MAPGCLHCLLAALPVSALAAPLWAEAAVPAEEAVAALAADDHCAGAGATACALSALQLRRDPLALQEAGHRAGPAPLHEEVTASVSRRRRASVRKRDITAYEEKHLERLIRARDHEIVDIGAELNAIWAAVNETHRMVMKELASTTDSMNSEETPAETFEYLGRSQASSVLKNPASRTAAKANLYPKERRVKNMLNACWRKMQRIWDGIKQATELNELTVKMISNVDNEFESEDDAEAEEEADEAIAPERDREISADWDAAAGPEWDGEIATSADKAPGHKLSAYARPFLRNAKKIGYEMQDALEDINRLEELSQKTRKLFEKNFRTSVKQWS